MSCSATERMQQQNKTTTGSSSRPQSPQVEVSYRITNNGVTKTFRDHVDLSIQAKIVDTPSSPTVTADLSSCSSSDCEGGRSPPARPPPPLTPPLKMETVSTDGERSSPPGLDESGSSSPSKVFTLRVGAKDTVDRGHKIQSFTAFTNAKQAPSSLAGDKTTTRGPSYGNLKRERPVTTSTATMSANTATTADSKESEAEPQPKYGGLGGKSVLMRRHLRETRKRFDSADYFKSTSSASSAGEEDDHDAGQDGVSSSSSDPNMAAQQRAVHQRLKTRGGLSIAPTNTSVRNIIAGPVRTVVSQATIVPSSPTSSPKSSRRDGAGSEVASAIGQPRQKALAVATMTTTHFAESPRNVFRTVKKNVDCDDPAPASAPAPAPAPAYCNITSRVTYAPVVSAINYSGANREVAKQAPAAGGGSGGKYGALSASKVLANKILREQKKRFDSADHFMVNMPQQTHNSEEQQQDYDNMSLPSPPAPEPIHAESQSTPEPSPVPETTGTKYGSLSAKKVLAHKRLRENRTRFDSAEYFSSQPSADAGGPGVRKELTASKPVGSVRHTAVTPDASREVPSPSTVKQTTAASQATAAGAGKYPNSLSGKKTVVRRALNHPVKRFDSADFFTAAQSSPSSATEEAQRNPETQSSIQRPEAVSSTARRPVQTFIIGGGGPSSSRASVTTTISRRAMVITPPPEEPQENTVSTEGTRATAALYEQGSPDYTEEARDAFTTASSHRERGPDISADVQRFLHKRISPPKVMRFDSADYFSSLNSNRTSGAAAQSATKGPVTSQSSSSTPTRIEQDAQFTASAPSASLVDIESSLREVRQEKQRLLSMLQAVETKERELEEMLNAEKKKRSEFGSKSSQDIGTSPSDRYQTKRTVSSGSIISSQSERSLQSGGSKESTDTDGYEMIDLPTDAHSTGSVEELTDRVRNGSAQPSTIALSVSERKIVLDGVTQRGESGTLSPRALLL